MSIELVQKLRGLLKEAAEYYHVTEYWDMGRGGHLREFRDCTENCCVDYKAAILEADNFLEED